MAARLRRPSIAACFGKKAQARIKHIEGALETLRSLGKLE